MYLYFELLLNKWWWFIIIEPSVPRYCLNVLRLDEKTFVLTITFLRILTMEFRKILNSTSTFFNKETI